MWTDRTIMIAVHKSKHDVRIDVLLAEVEVQDDKT